MLGLNCGGSINTETARKMVAKKFAVDPDSVKKDGISKRKFRVQTSNGEFSVYMDELEEENMDRRSNCRRD